MEPEGTATDDLDVELRWPGGPGEPGRPAAGSGSAAGSPGGRGQATSPPPAPLFDPGRTDPAEVPAGVPGDAVQSGLASIAIRLDALTNASSMLRNLVADRLADYGDQVSRAQSTSAREMEDYRRLHDRAVAELEAGIGEWGTSLQRLERSVTGLAGQLERLGQDTASRLGPLERLERLESATDDLAARLDRSGHDIAARLDRAEQEIAARLGQFERLAGETAIDLGPVLGQLDEIASTVTAAAARQPGEADLAAIAAGLQTLREEVRNEIAAVSDVDKAVVRLAADRSDEVDRVLEAIETVGGRHRAATAELASVVGNLDARLAALEAAASSPPESPAVDSILERLQEMSRQMEILRRRLALRARNETTFDAGTIDALADAVAVRLMSPEPEPEPPVAGNRARRRQG